MWTEDFGNAEILKFGLQIILIVVTGEAIAASPPARWVLTRLVRIPTTAAQACLVVTGFAVITGWVHWGFGLPPAGDAAPTRVGEVAQGRPWSARAWAGQRARRTPRSTATASAA